MAETLSVAEMLPNKFEPKRQFRWVFAIEGIDAFLMKSAARPQIQTGEVKMPFINHTRYVAGRTEFSTLGVTLYDPIAPSGAGYADFYKRDLQLKMLDPIGTVVELWDVKGAFITDANFNDLNYDSENPTEISVTMRFDNCVLQY